MTTPDAKMNLINEYAEEWLQALESGEYKQWKKGLMSIPVGTNHSQLRDKTYLKEKCNFCCIAVAELLHGNSTINTDVEFVHKTKTYYCDYDKADHFLFEEEFMFEDTFKKMNMFNENGTFLHTVKTIQWFKQKLDHDQIMGQKSSLYQMNDLTSATFLQIAEFIRTFPELFFKEESSMSC